MQVSEVMTHGVRSCSVHDSLQEAARIMWESDCGCVPIVDDVERVVGMLTDRDICMAGYTQGKPFAQIPVSAAMAKRVFAVAGHDDIEGAELLMRARQIRRLPVLDRVGRLEGIITLNDLARRAEIGRDAEGRTGDGLSGDTIATTLAAISKPHSRESRKAAAPAR